MIYNIQNIRKYMLAIAVQDKVQQTLCVNRSLPSEHSERVLYEPVTRILLLAYIYEPCVLRDVAQDVRT